MGLPLVLPTFTRLAASSAFHWRVSGPRVSGSVSFLLLFFFDHLQHMELRDQGSDQSRPQLGYARSLTHCAGLRIEPASQCSQDATDLVVLGAVSLVSYFCVMAGGEGTDLTHPLSTVQVIRAPHTAEGGG